MGKLEVYKDNIYRTLYATDASAYREMPYGVCFPKCVNDIVEIIEKASKKGLSVIPRCAGTSLAGQVVGSGIVADVSRYMTGILETNPKEQWVRVEPGVILDELNIEMAEYGLFFGPETSTSNRCCIGGMVGNNSCGSHSLVYGSTRDHLLEAKVVLSDGSFAVFSQERAAEVLREILREEKKDAYTNKSKVGVNTQSTQNLENKREIIYTDSLEKLIYLQLYRLAMNSSLLEKVNDEFPVKEVKRRNCGYALDLVLNDIRGFVEGEMASDKTIVSAPNLCTILAGSEGTLAFAYELKLNLEQLPPKEKVVVCVHCENLPNVFKANLVALKYKPVAVELMDSNVLELSKGNLSQQKNRFFVQGDPAAILIVEMAKDSREELDILAEELEKELLSSGLVYYCSRVYGKDISRVWELRKAGLGLLSGMKGDSKPISVIEDTAVAPDRLPDYMADFGQMLGRLGLNCVYHAHIGTGELHLRPILNIKDDNDRRLFKQVAYETALLVKKHKGSLSGEHGDGRLRGEFIPLMYGEEIYQVLRSVKKVWDPNGVLNIGKIVDTPPIDTCLRYDVGQRYTAEKFMISDNTACINSQHSDMAFSTYFDFSSVKGLFCAVEQCNGSGDCRRSVKFAGVLCPSYRVDMEERFSTRARANILREVLTRGNFGANALNNPFCSNEVYEVLDSCLSCKACKRECPSNVDMTRIKAEYLQHRFDALGHGIGKGEFPWWGGVPFRSFMVAHMADIQHIGSIITPMYNLFASWRISERILKKILQFTLHRQIPSLSRKSLRVLVRNAMRKRKGISTIAGQNRKVYLFADEFTNYMEAELGLKFIELLTKFGYEVVIPKHFESGRAALSKGLLKVARRLAVKNVLALKDIVSGDTPLVGIEPSCILSFRDEYPALVGSAVKALQVKGFDAKQGEQFANTARALGENCLLFDEFIMREVKAGRISSDMFTTDTAEIWLHGHCHQKALTGIEASAAILALPVNYKVNVIPSGCCGMAGSFGYEKEHYATSMAIGTQILFPAVRAVEAKCKKNPIGNYIISAPGTSCRQQIFDGTGIKVQHPVEVLLGALIR